MNEYEQLINTIDEIIKSGVESSDYMIGKIEMSIDLFRQSKNKPKYIKQIVARFFNLTEFDLNIVTRKTEIKEARQIAMYFYNKYTKLSLKMIADEFSTPDHVFVHATVISANKRIKDLIDSDSLFKAQIEVIEEEVKRHY